MAPVERFSTRGFLGHERFDMWRGTVAQLHELELAEPASAEAFEAEVTAWSLGALAVAGGHFTERRMLRSRRLTRRLQIDHYRLLLPMGGTELEHSAGDLRQRVTNGQMVFSDLAWPEDANCGTGELMQFIVARDVLDELLPRPPDLHGLVPTGPLASLVADHLQTFVRQLPHLEAGEARHVAQATLQLVAALAQAQPPREPEVRSALEGALRQRIIRHIDRNLTNPGLSQDAICRAFGVSRASLYRLFQPLGGVAAHIQERRLRRIHAELCRPVRRHLGKLSWQYGFSSQAQMSRAFRILFGYPPSETEPGGQTTTSPVTTEALVSFEPILRRLELNATQDTFRGGGNRTASHQAVSRSGEPLRDKTETDSQKLRR